MINGSAKKTAQKVKKKLKIILLQRITKLIRLYLKKLTRALVLETQTQKEKVEKPKEEEALILDNFHEEKKLTDNKKSETSKPLVSPAARKIASEAKVNLKEVKGSGKNGVILKEDVMNLMGSKPPPSERER